MDEFLDEMDDEQVDDLLQPVEGEDKTPQLYEHFRLLPIFILITEWQSRRLKTVPIKSESIPEI